MSRSRRSPRAGLLSAVLALTALAAGACRDSTEVTAPRLADATAETVPAMPASAADPGATLVYGAHVGGDTLAKYLPMTGATVTREATTELPADLTPYKSIWYVDPNAPIGAADRARLVAFVQGGGGLYVSGDHDACCQPLNQSIDALVGAVVKNGAAVQVGGAGTQQSHFLSLSVYIFDPVVPGLGGASWEPNGAGGINFLTVGNALVRDWAFGTAPAGAAWDAASLVGDVGRFVVLMDVDWLTTVGPSIWNWNAMLRISQFLLDAPEPNVAPTASAGGPYSGGEGVPVGFSAAASTDANGDALTFRWDLDADGAFDDATGPSAEKTFGDDGSFMVRVQVTDAKGASSIAGAAVTVGNRNPTMSFSAPQSVLEGNPIALTASGASDVAADLATLAITYSCDGGVTFGAVATCAAVDGPATLSVVGRVTDKDGGSTDYSASVGVTNVLPAIASLNLPNVVVAVGTPVQLSATFTDGWLTDGHSASVDWDGAISSGNIGGTTSPRTVSASHVYTTPGVYTVTLTVSDDEPNTADSETHQYVVVYDPNGGFVTGGGWIAYGATACPTLCEGASGRGDFGFVSKYLKGASVPSGDTRFEFHAGALRFESTAYEWLVVAGGRAQFKGTGSIGGSGVYGFLVTAVDGATDAFRIKIWNKATNAVVFDNQMGVDEDAPAATLLDKVSGNGSIVIRTK